jgi:antitoxin ParD1/3/4
MSTMNISLPETLKSFVDQQVAEGRYGTSSEYIRELIRRDLDRARLRNLLLEGAASPPVGVFDDPYFDAFRESILKRAKK